MPRQLVNREEQGKLIARTNGAVTMINESNYSVRSITGYNTYIVHATQSGWACSCPDYARYNRSASMYMQSNFIAIKIRQINNHDHSLARTHASILYKSSLFI